MPKWSQVPWGTVLTGITGTVALYGAVLSTLNYWRAGPRLSVLVHTGMIIVPSNDKRRFIQTEVTNYGDRPATLTNIALYHFEKPWSWAYLRNRATNTAVLNNPNPEKPFPYELKPGGVWCGLATGAGDREVGHERGLVFQPFPFASTKPKRKRVRFSPPGGRRWAPFGARGSSLDLVDPAQVSGPSHQLLARWRRDEWLGRVAADRGWSDRRISRFARVGRP
jgi:hypothetical protein